MEIPIRSENDMLLSKYVNDKQLPKDDVWLLFFKKTINDWSESWSNEKIAEIRNWIYICLQRNLRWTDVITYWIEAIYDTEWITPSIRSRLLKVLWNAESGSGWVLVTSYRIPILWEHVHLELAREMYKLRNNIN